MLTDMFNQVPELSLVEEFILESNSLIDFYIKNKEDPSFAKCHVESTLIADKLASMLDILMTDQQENNKSDGSMCVTMEYLLQSDILNTLSLVAESDVPLGVFPQILSFFINLLKKSRAELMPHKSVYPSLLKMITICGKRQASPYESTEILFLTTIADQIQLNTPYLNLFIDSSSFSLLNSLLMLLESPDSNVSNVSADCIIKLLRLINPNADRIICEKTPFCSKIINRAIDHYLDIPKTLKPSDVQLAISTFKNESTTTNQHSLNSPSRKFLCFLKWYTYIDMLVANIPDGFMLSIKLLQQFKTDFLEGHILSDITGDGFQNETDCLANVSLTIMIMSNCVKNTESRLLLDLICEFLVLPERRDVALKSKFNNYHIVQYLIQKCISAVLDSEKSNEDERVLLFTLITESFSLFSDILSRPCYSVVHHLVIQYIDQRQYLTGGLNSYDENNFDNIDISHVVANHTIGPEVLEVIKKEVQQIGEIRNFHDIPIWPRDKIGHSLYYFRSLIPDELKTEDSDECSLTEIVRAFIELMTKCCNHWTFDLHSQQRSEQSNCNEGPFLQLIFTSLHHIITLPYKIIVQVMIFLVGRFALNMFHLGSIADCQDILAAELIHQRILSGSLHQWNRIQHFI